jgi:hypothetical protein
MIWVRACIGSLCSGSAFPSCSPRTEHRIPQATRRGDGCKESNLGGLRLPRRFCLKFCLLGAWNERPPSVPSPEMPAANVQPSASSPENRGKSRPRQPSKCGPISNGIIAARSEMLHLMARLAPLLFEPNSNTGGRTG